MRLVLYQEIYERLLYKGPTELAPLYPNVPGETLQGIYNRQAQSIGRRRIWKFEALGLSPHDLLAEFMARWEDAPADDLIALLAQKYGEVPPCFLARILVRAYCDAEKSTDAGEKFTDTEGPAGEGKESTDVGKKRADAERPIDAERSVDTRAFGETAAPIGIKASVETAAPVDAEKYTAAGTPTATEESKPNSTEALIATEESKLVATEESKPVATEESKLVATEESKPVATEGPKPVDAPVKSRQSHTKLYREPGTIPHAGMAANVAHCHQVDPHYSPQMDEFRTRIGREYEDRLAQHLSALGVSYLDEPAMRRMGYARTPDAVLLEPIAVDGFVVKWIESKAWFGDPPSHATYLRDQYWPYYNRFGPGLVIYWFGFVEEATEAHQAKGVLVLDAFPSAERITRIESDMFALIRQGTSGVSKSSGE